MDFFVSGSKFANQKLDKIDIDGASGDQFRVSDSHFLSVVDTQLIEKLLLLAIC